MQRGSSKFLGSAQENFGVVSIFFGRKVVGLHRGSFSEPGLLHENSAAVVSGGKYVGAVGLPLILDGTVGATGCSPRVAGPRVRDGLSVLTASSATLIVTGATGSLGSGRVGLPRPLVGASVTWSRTGARLGPLVRRLLARVIGDVISTGFAVVSIRTVVDFCFFGPSINGTSPHFGASQPLRQISMSHLRKT